MAPRGTLYMYRSLKTRGLFCFSPQDKGDGLPDSLAPWKVFGTVRPGEAPPHGLSRAAIESGIDERGFQLWRRKKAKDGSTSSHSNS